VRHIRTVIFGLEAAGATAGIRQQIMALTSEASASLGFDPRVTFDGPVDATVDETTAPELIATLREALSNVARHAAARHVDVEVTAAEDVVLVVRDDGRGFTASTDGPGRGLRNMRSRAERLGGYFHVAPAANGGTKLEWRVPVKPSTG
jgi:signal transduction histidine kinase